MKFLKLINQTIHVIIDRPMNSQHPVHGFTYPVNYGYIPNTISGDGEEIDAYILGVSDPLESFTGLCIAIIHRLDDDDDKLIIVPQGFFFSDEEIRTATHFQEQWFKNIILRESSSQDE